MILTMKKLSDAPRIAILYPEFLGDYVQLVPFLHLLRKIRPHAVIDLYVSSNMVDFARFHPAVNEVLEIPVMEHQSREPHKVRDFIRQLKASRYDAACFSNHYLFWILKRARVPFIIKEQSSLEYRLFAHGTPPRLLRDQLVNRAAFLVRNLEAVFQVSHPVSDYNYDLGIPASEMVWQRPLPDHYVVLAPDVHSGKNFSKQYYLAVLNWLVSRSIPVVIVGLKDPYQLKQEYADNPLVQSVAGQTRLTQLCGIISRARFFIGMDSGTSHLAAALQVRSLTCFPAKGARPCFFGANWKDNLSYKQSVFSRQCPDYCWYYPNCSAGKCLEAFDWPAIESRLAWLTSDQTRTWDEKIHDDLKANVAIRVICASELPPQAAVFFEHMRQSGYAVHVETNRPFSTLRYREIWEWLTTGHSQVLHFFAPELPIKFRIWNTWFRLSERAYCTLLAGNTLAESPRHLFELYIKSLSF